MGGFERFVVVVLSLAIVAGLAGFFVFHHSNGSGVVDQTTNRGSAEQRFADDAQARIPQIRSLPISQIRQEGDGACNLMAQDVEQNAANPFGRVVGFAEFGELPFTGQDFSFQSESSHRLTGIGAETFTSLAIEDICPTFRADIPYGARRT
jgi:hypothetical protein